MKPPRPEPVPALLPRRRDLLKAGIASLFVPSQALARPRVASSLPVGTEGGTAGDHAPAAVPGTGWGQKSNWNFGTAPGRNVAKLTDWLAAGWFMDETPKWLNNECETYNTTDSTDNNPNFMPFPDHCDIVAIWNGGAIEAARGNGSITSLCIRYDAPFPNAIGYYELTCKVPSVSGAWPAWWTIGHPPGTGRGIYTWGPEIDIFELYDTNTALMTSTLHGGKSPSYCFMNAGGEPPGRAETSAAVYEGNHPWNLGDLTYRPGFDFAQAYHRFGLKIDANYNISIWVDDIRIGIFGSNRYCDDSGRPVAVELLVNLAVGTNNPDPVRSIHTADFGGAGNRGLANKFRLSIKNIQVWGP